MKEVECHLACQQSPECLLTSVWLHSLWEIVNRQLSLLFRSSSVHFPFLQVRCSLSGHCLKTNNVLRNSSSSTTVHRRWLSNDIKTLVNTLQQVVICDCLKVGYSSQPISFSVSINIQGCGLIYCQTKNLEAGH